MNRSYEVFRNNVINTIQNSDIELGAAYYILKDVLGEVEKAYSHSIQQELEAEAQQVAEAEQESEDEDE